MKDNMAGSLLMIEKNKLLGMVTDRKFAIDIAAAGKDPANTPVSQFMIKNLATIGPDQKECDASRIMGENKYRRSPVVEKIRQSGWSGFYLRSFQTGRGLYSLQPEHPE